METLQGLPSLNLNCCQKISDNGIEAITSASPKLKNFSIYWNVRVTDLSMKHLVKNCKEIIDLNLSGCKNITDQSLHLIDDNYQELEVLNLTSLTDQAYRKMEILPHLKFLDLCGTQSYSCNQIFL
ncbi:F-box protein At3g58530 isoform X2 [Magnolia sinica]|uniref:F-box protein At3g58530 isoform X2 n=1 Tax=Magnolia sinica TaxID=86752 RepID=UPI00265A97FC|nr:F-box protein At3g58530 isoform X2 [Magnolia sinica]